MPPHHALKGTSHLSRQPVSRYVCPSCRIRDVISRTAAPKKPRLRLHQRGRRAASTIASVTAVNAKKAVPDAFRDLYDALSGLQHEAATYTNLSQLQLALRGLESENGVTRVAALGGSDARATRRLVKTLLADPLQPEAEWEKQLSGLDDGDERALLLRHNLEVLVQPTLAQSEENGLGAQTYLIPGLETPASATGRLSTISYPVHKALILAQGLSDIKALLPSRTSEGQPITRDMITAVVNTSWDSLSAAGQPMSPVHPINLDRAEQAIATFRQSLDNSFDYEHAWFQSGMPRISAWLIEGTETLPAILKPTILRLIETLTTNIERAIDHEEAEQLHKQASAIIPTSTRDLMNTFVTDWAEAAHTELRDQLDLAFSSKNWRKLAWWKLAWRVDDVSSITSDILRQSWLVDADRGILYLAGRIEQAGLLPCPMPGQDPAKPADSNPHHHAPTIGNPLPESTAPLPDFLPATTTTTTHTTTTTATVTPSTLPSIFQARQTLLTTTLPPLQSLAQRLLLQAFSTTLFSSSLSALLYISLSTTSAYETGGVAALGVVLAARRLQQRWEKGREVWMGEVREEGRRVLRGVEEGWRYVCREGGMGGGEETGGMERERARRAVRRVREALLSRHGVGR
ncbi:MAG: hypothetical protein Q9219_006715 [cf. Caloplaca sp. 3 TL-2023]